MYTIYSISVYYAFCTSYIYLQNAFIYWSLTHPLRHISGKDLDRRLENHESTVSIGGRTITNLRFADDIDGLVGEEEELANLVERLDKASTAYGMEISAKKTKLIKNNTTGIHTEIKVNGQRLETATSFKYLGSVTTDEGSKPEILSRIAQATAVVWSCFPFIRSGQNHLARHSERGKKTRQTKEEVGRQQGNGQAWSSPSLRGQRRTGKNGGNWL